jgi:uncharacterized membrane protein YfcA
VPYDPSVPTVVIGLLAGLIAGAFGVGGGILIVPGLLWFTKYDQRLAHGTSLAAVVPISAASLIPYLVNGAVEWLVAGVLVGGSVLGAVAGTALLQRLPLRTLTVAFAALLASTAVRMFLSPGGGGDGSLGWRTILFVAATGLFAGLVSGMLGVGGGIVMVPALVLFAGFLPLDAKGTSLAVILPTALIGTWRNRRNDNANLRAAAVIGGSGALAAVAGGFVSALMPVAVANVSFAVLISGVALRMLLQLRRR